jgi:D-alanine transaminase
MFRIAYVNGRYLHAAESAVNIEDRGYQFADGVYEVAAVVGGVLVDSAPHLARLARSLKELDIAWPVSRRALTHIVAEVVRRNAIDCGMVYLQITRGVAPRDHAYPQGIRPALVVTAKRLTPQKPELVEHGVPVITIPDLRWQRCDIKSVSLLPNVMGKQSAKDAGAYEAWQISAEGYVTEGTSTNAWIVDRNGTVVTHAADHSILGGITRESVLKVGHSEGIKIVERRFTLKDTFSAREAFLTSTTAAVLPVVSVDGRKIGDGKPGPVTLRLRERYLATLDRQVRAASGHSS